MPARKATQQDIARITSKRLNPMLPDTWKTFDILFQASGHGSSIQVSMLPGGTVNVVMSVRGRMITTAIPAETADIMQFTTEE